MHAISAVYFICRELWNASHFPGHVFGRIGIRAKFWLVDEH